MSPQTGIKLSGNSNKKQKERAHGDKVMFGVNSTEALEEYFFKVMTNDRFIGEQDLQEYSVSEGLANDYENYLQLICKESSTYLTKNNNFILRAKSHLEIDQQVKLILIIYEQHQIHLHQMMDRLPHILVFEILLISIHTLHMLTSF